MKKKVKGKLTQEAEEAKNVYFGMLKQFRHVFEEDEDFAKYGVPLLPEQIEGLVNSGLIDKLEHKDGKLKYEINRERFDEIFASPIITANELLELFNTVKLKNIETGQVFSAANIDDIRKFREDYAEAIEDSILEHKEIIKDCNYAIDNNLLNTGLQKVLQNRTWTAWRKERLNNNDKPNVVDRRVL